MTREEAIKHLKFMQNAYQELIDTGVKNGTVLIWERYYSHKRSRFVDDYNFGWIYKDNWMCEGGGESEVIAWTPLIEPYKAESEVEK